MFLSVEGRVELTLRIHVIQRGENLCEQLLVNFNPSSPDWTSTFSCTLATSHSLIGQSDTSKELSAVTLIRQVTLCMYVWICVLLPCAHNRKQQGETRVYGLIEPQRSLLLWNRTAALQARFPCWPGMEHFDPGTGAGKHDTSWRFKCCRDRPVPVAISPLWVRQKQVGHQCQLAVQSTQTVLYYIKKHSNQLCNLKRAENVLIFSLIYTLFFFLFTFYSNMNKKHLLRKLGYVMCMFS